MLIKNHPELSHKILLDTILEEVNQWKDSNLKIIFTNGCFDLLHLGHIEYLEEAKSLGDILVVGLNDDDSVSRLKGSNRPLNPLSVRARMLEALSSVDFIIPFEEDTPERLIRTISPNVIVKGGDYALEEMIGKEYVESYGGEVKLLSFKEGFSSSKLIEKIKKL